MDDYFTELKLTCRVCGRPMIKRTSQYGGFLGCSGYPACKNKLSRHAYEQEVRAYIGCDENTEDDYYAPGGPGWGDYGFKD